MVRGLVSILIIVTLVSLLFIEVQARTPFDAIVEEIMKIVFFQKGKLGLGREKPEKRLDVSGGIKTDELCLGDKCFATVCKTVGGWLLSETSDCPKPAPAKAEAPAASQLTIKAAGPVAAASDKARLANNDTFSFTFSASGPLTIRAVTFELFGTTLAWGAKIPVNLVKMADNTLWGKSETASCLPVNSRCRVVFNPEVAMKSGETIKLKFVVDATLFSNSFNEPDSLGARIVNDYDVVLKPGVLGNKTFPIELGEVNYQ